MKKREYELLKAQQQLTASLVYLLGQIVNHQMGLDTLARELESNEQEEGCDSCSIHKQEQKEPKDHKIQPVKPAEQEFLVTYQ